MKKVTVFSVVGILVVSLALFAFKSLDGPWTADQLIEPEVLAKKLNGSGEKPVVISVGPMQPIKTSINAGIGNTTAGMNKFIQIVNKLDREQTVVIYCGCCSMENCPNVKGPFEYLINSGFQNPKILKIKTDLNVDWVNKGFPMAN